MLGYTYLDDPSLTTKQKRRFQDDSETREIFLIKNDQEVRQSILDTISNSVVEPIQGKLKKKKTFMNRIWSIQILL